jgi:hypothetical protein
MVLIATGTFVASTRRYWFRTGMTGSASAFVCEFTTLVAFETVAIGKPFMTMGTFATTFDQ